ncbi:MAG: cyclase family protein [Gemmatimonadaceae bacterium]|nr:cyclase family protein [Gemmatimonadaceae bacterium]
MNGVRHDISIAYGAATPPFPGDTPFHCGWAWEMAHGASVNVGRITTSLHVGTHADAPLHVRVGAPASETLPLDAFHGPALVLDVRGVGDDHVITRDELAARLADARPARLLLRTGRSVSAGTFPTAWPALARPRAARHRRTECRPATGDRARGASRPLRWWRVQP